ncbi:MAG: CDF family Co(II)/Ni(II) efflux transporter DmeF [Halioglobus sp.]|nr:CDF family Co(II)/Ni(II) efflux transporter DmeF [Halioglobus sp.]
MHTHRTDNWTHDHVFNQDAKRAGENRTLLIVAVTAVMMVVEISTGLLYGSMALLADGLHMGSHATALGISVFAYMISRRMAADRRFSFGVGKINSLAGFASAVLLLGFALVMIVESVNRFITPQSIAFDQALIVAVIGLVVNGGSAWVLISTPHDHGHGHGHGHHHDHRHGHDHNLRAAYLHVLADAVTSLLAIAALLAGKYLGANWLDPLMGIVGGLLVARWSYGLIRDSSHVLLDTQAQDSQLALLQEALEHDSTDRVCDLHYWSIGHGIYAAEIVIVSDDPLPPEHYKARIPSNLSIAHVTVEVHRCTEH